MLTEGCTLSLLGAQMLAHPLAVSADWQDDQTELAEDLNLDQFPDELEMFASHLSKERIDRERIQDLKNIARMFRSNDPGIMELPFSASRLGRLTLKLGEGLREIPQEPYQRAINNMLAGGRYSFPHYAERLLIITTPLHKRNARDITAFGPVMHLLAALAGDSATPFYFRKYGDALTIAGSERRAHKCYQRAASLWMAEARTIFESGSENSESIHWMEECLRRARDMQSCVGESSVEDVVAEV